MCFVERSFYIAISFVQQKRFKESAALVNKTDIYMEQAKKIVSEGQQPKSSEINYQVGVVHKEHFDVTLSDVRHY